MCQRSVKRRNNIGQSRLKITMDCCISFTVLFFAFFHRSVFSLLCTFYTNFNETNARREVGWETESTERGAAVCWNYEVRSGAVQQDDAVEKSDVVLATVGKKYTSHVCVIRLGYTRVHTHMCLKLHFTYFTRQDYGYVPLLFYAWYILQKVHM